MKEELRRLRLIRVAFYVIIIFFGAVQFWWLRHEIFSDGISYIEIANAYLHRDWPNAINAYWSPLYSWLLALAFWLFRPTPYWQVATLHAVNLGGYIGGLIVLEFCLHELVKWLRGSPLHRNGMISETTLRIGTYAVFPLATLQLISYCSPDIFGVLFMLLLSGLVLRIARTGGSPASYVLIGVTCALFYFARTAFAPVIPICIITVLILIRRKQGPLLYPGTLMVSSALILVMPFVVAISLKTHRPTIGESGRLNYAWEVDGASRSTHWQGEPYDIGTPQHPTIQVSVSPRAYVFNGRVAGSYPPWFDPSYWYAGVQPKIKWATQIRVLLVDFSIAMRLVATSPIFLVLLILVGFMGSRTWWPRVAALWPILIPAIAGILVYCFVFVEKRYIAGNLLVIWLALLASIYFESAESRRWTEISIRGVCVLFLCLFAATKVATAAKLAIHDLMHGSEGEPNWNYVLAQRFRELGLHAGDKIAFIGIGMDADWARLDQVRIVGEVPVIWGRDQKLFENYFFEDPRSIRKFWADSAARERILQDFKNAGAVMAVTDGLFRQNFPPDWPLVLPSEHSRPKDYSNGNLGSRYKWLVANGNSAQCTRPESCRDNVTAQIFR